MASNELLKLQAKGGDISKVLAELEGSDVDVLRAIVQEVRSQTPQQPQDGGGELSGMSDEQLQAELARITGGR